MTATATTKAAHDVARSIMLEAVARVAGKDHDRAVVPPGSFPFEFAISGTVGNRDVSAAYSGTLNVDPDGIATPSTPYQDIAVFLLSKMNAATQATCLEAIAAGEFGSKEEVKTAKSAVAHACKQFRERKQAAAPKTKSGNVKAVYEAAGAAIVESAAEPASRRKAG